MQSSQLWRVIGRACGLTAVAMGGSLVWRPAGLQPYLRHGCSLVGLGSRVPPALAGLWLWLWLPVLLQARARGCIRCSGLRLLGGQRLGVRLTKWTCC